MKKEILQKRLDELQKAIDQNMANLNMLMGGKEECLYWLKQIDPPTDPMATLPGDGMPLHDLKELLGADSVEVMEVKTG